MPAFWTSLLTAGHCAAQNRWLLTCVNMHFPSSGRVWMLFQDWMCCTCLLDAISSSSSVLVVKVMRSCKDEEFYYNLAIRCDKNLNSATGHQLHIDKEKTNYQKEPGNIYKFMFTMFRVRKYNWERLSHWVLSSQLSSISSLGAKTAWDTLPKHTAFWEKSGRGSLGLNTNTKKREKTGFCHVYSGDGDYTIR